MISTVFSFNPDGDDDEILQILDLGEHSPLWLDVCPDLGDPPGIILKTKFAQLFIGKEHIDALMAAIEAAKRELAK
jgi:hypothetical protein